PGLTGPGTAYGCAEGYNPPGCGWPVAHTLNVPAGWPSGIYTVEIPTTSANRYIVFWVREDNPGSTAEILFLSSANTYQAYTNFGGKSTYDIDSSDLTRTSKVSFNRPFRAYGLGDFDLEQGLAAWIENEGYALEYAANYDLHFNANLLDAYEILVLVGHSEYWSWDMRQRVKTFLNNGGRLINLSGNTMWWQIIFEDGGRTMVVYKKHEDDPDADNQQKGTENPWDYPINDPETNILGVHWKSGGYYNFIGTEELPTPGSETTPAYIHEDGYGGYWVQQADHWVFEGTGLANGALFGRTDNYATSVLGKENDGTFFNCASDGQTILGPLANSGTPANFTILGLSPVSLDGDHGFSVMGMYTHPGGGAVFSGSTMDWGKALSDSSNTQLAQITRNVFDKFIDKTYPQEPDSPESDYLFYDRFNCDNLYHSEGLGGRKWYEGIPSHNYFSYAGKNIQYSDECGFSGSGLAITMDPDVYFRYRTRLKPDWSGTNVLYSRLYLNLSNLTMSENDKFKFIVHSFDSRQPGTEAETQADLQIRWRKGKPQVRYQDIVAAAETEWVYVPADEPFLVETLWDKPNNQLVLWVDGLRYDGGYYINDEFVPGVNLVNDQPMHRTDIRMSGLDPGENIQGVLCIDELAFDDERIGALPEVFMGGYASKISVAQGQSIDFHISTDITPTHTLKIWREGATRHLMTTINDVPGAIYTCIDGYATGCGWPAAYTLDVPANWPSGIYTVEIPTSEKGNQYIIFWVREDNPASTSAILLLSSVNTYNAFTNFGGKSLEVSNS
ncbi:MAG: hypothetical protein GY869_18180, partial [Planctomycetes bacterium]|nr:hypothetical protein [Planctomycetota bacterium]